MTMFTYQGLNSQWKQNNEEREEEQEKEMVVGGMEETETEGNSYKGYLGYLQVMAHESKTIMVYKGQWHCTKGKGARPRATYILSIIYFSSTFNRVR